MGNGFHSERRRALITNHSRPGLIIIALIALMSSATAAAAGGAPTPVRYLIEYPDLSSLSFPLPPAPPGPNTDAGAVDLDEVRAAQMSADPAARADAFADADAFSFDQLLPRFSASAGRTLTPARRPILAHMLKLTLADTGFYGSIKNGLKRARPFTEPGSSIVPCDQSFLSNAAGSPDTFSYSYPSGHSTNGYAAAMLIADVIPDHANAIIARGVRYGTNRVVCGVHYPTDVAAGQLFGRFIFKLIRSEHQFQTDLSCAREEDVLDRTGAMPGFDKAKDETARRALAAKAYSAGCASLAVAYFDDISGTMP